MKDTGSKITICNDTMDENFYIKGIIYIMLCHVYNPKFVMTFPPQISHSVSILYIYILYHIFFSQNYYLTVLNYLPRLMMDAVWMLKKSYDWFPCSSGLIVKCNISPFCYKTVKIHMRLNNPRLTIS